MVQQGGKHQTQIVADVQREAGRRESTSLTKSLGGRGVGVWT